MDIKYKPKTKAMSCKLFGHRLARLSVRMAAAVEQQKKNVDRFIAKIDLSVEATEVLFRSAVIS